MGLTIAPGVIGPDGTVAAGTALPDVDRRRSMLVDMIEARLASQRMFALQRQGRIGTFAPIDGQEGTVVGLAHALDPTVDWLFPYYREQMGLRRFGDGLLAREVLVLRGHPAGSHVPNGMHVFPKQVSLGTQVPHAVGFAWGLRAQGLPGIVATVFGDGSSSEGDVWEAQNLAGVMKLPVVFVCMNNGWAISTPASHQNAAPHFASRAEGFGFDGVVVDGNDALAVHGVINVARRRAVEGGGPTLVEAVTYRMGPHTTADDPTRYVPPDERAAWAERDPIERLRGHLRLEGAWTDADDDAARSAATLRIDAAVDAAMAAPLDETAMFDNVYADDPPRLRHQRQQFLAERRSS